MPDKDQEQEQKEQKAAKSRGKERPTWAAHDSPGNPGKGPGGRKGGAFVPQRIKKSSARGR